MKKHGAISTYFCLKHHCGKEDGHFFHTVYTNNNHVTTHPGAGGLSVFTTHLHAMGNDHENV